MNTNYCIMSDKGYVMFLIDDCKSVHVNVLPQNNSNINATTNQDDARKLSRL